MPDLSPFSFLTGVVDAAAQIDPTGTIKTLTEVFSDDYSFKSDVFPEDLGAEYMNHYMIMKFYTGRRAQAPTGSFGGGFGNNNYNVALFMPSENYSGAFPIFEDNHEYAEISMSNIFMHQLAGGGRALRGAAGLTGRAINPGIQVLYKSTHLRNFTFSFMFAPKSEKESRDLESIIKNIRKYAAPLDQGLFYRSPAEVDISFHWAGKENPHIIKMKRQFMTQVQVNYTPSGVYSTFTNGYPVSVLLQLSTKEVEIIDRNDVDEGY